MSKARPLKRSSRAAAPASSLTRFKAVLDAYGATPEAWPEEERAALLQTARSAPVAQQLWSETVRFDAVLRELEPPAPSAALQARVGALATGGNAKPATAAAGNPSRAGRRSLLRAFRVPRLALWTGVPLAAALAVAVLVAQPWSVEDGRPIAATPGTAPVAVAEGEVYAEDAVAGEVALVAASSPLADLPLVDTAALDDAGTTDDTFAGDAADSGADGALVLALSMPGLDTLPLE